MSNHIYIWDLDGTLLDSYKAIVNTVHQTYKEYGAERDWEEIHKFVIATSVQTYFEKMKEETGITYEEIRERYEEISEINKLNIKAFPQAKEILSRLKEMGARHFVFTHRGESTWTILKKQGLIDFFEEIVNSQSGFARKPSPEGLNYLIEKYQLDRSQTFYVGDRNLDMECAKAAGVRGILYKPEDSVCVPNGAEDYIVSQLIDIEELEKTL